MAHVYMVSKNGDNSTVNKVLLKKRATQKELLKKDPKTYFKSFGKAKKALTVDIKAQLTTLKDSLKKFRKIKKKTVKTVKYADVKAGKVSVDVKVEKTDKKEKNGKKSKE